MSTKNEAGQLRGHGRFEDEIAPEVEISYLSSRPMFMRCRGWIATAVSACLYGYLAYAEARFLADELLIRDESTGSTTAKDLEGGGSDYMSR